MPLYLGRRKQGDLILFRWPTTPTKESHGHLFAAVIGPFESKVGASYFARYGRNNPHIRTAGDADRLAREDPRMEQAIIEESMSAAELAIARECEAHDQLEYSPNPTVQGANPCLTNPNTNA